MKLNGWDHALKVTATGEGLVGHAGAILLRKAADVTGLTSLLSGALEEKGKSPLLDRGTVLVLTAAAIALGATSMSDVALLRHLAPLMGSGPGGLRWIARRVKPSRRHKKNLTAHERKTGWKYSITCTNIPDAGMPQVPGSHHPQFIDAVYRDHATVETDGVRTAKAMGLRNLPSKSWQVNAGWVIAANIAADLTAWTRLLGHHDDEELRKAEPDTLRYRVWHLPARLAAHARQRTVALSPDWPWMGAFITCWNRLRGLTAPA